jgi:hypothetical protein
MPIPRHARPARDENLFAFLAIFAVKALANHLFNAGKYTLYNFLNRANLRHNESNLRIYA